MSTNGEPACPFVDSPLTGWPLLPGLCGNSTIVWGQCWMFAVSSPPEPPHKGNAMYGRDESGGITVCIVCHEI